MCVCTPNYGHCANESQVMQQLAALRNNAHNCNIWSEIILLGVPMACNSVVVA